MVSDGLPLFASLFFCNTSPSPKWLPVSFPNHRCDQVIFLLAKTYMAPQCKTSQFHSWHSTSFPRLIPLTSQTVHTCAHLWDTSILLYWLMPGMNRNLSLWPFKLWVRRRLCSDAFLDVLIWNQWLLPPLVPITFVMLLAALTVFTSFVYMSTSSTRLQFL